MKQCIKLSIIIILAALLHNGATKAADFLCTPASNPTECCFLSQAPATQQAVQNFYDHFYTVSLHGARGQYTSARQQKYLVAYKLVQNAATCPFAGVRPLVVLISPSGARYQLLYIRAKKDNHLIKGRQAH